MGVSTIFRNINKGTNQFGIHMKYLFNRQLNVKDINWVHDEMQQNILTNQ